MPSWSPQSTYRVVAGARVPCESVFWDSWFDLLSPFLVEIPPVRLKFLFRSSPRCFPVWSEEGSCLPVRQEQYAFVQCRTAKICSVASLSWQLKSRSSIGDDVDGGGHQPRLRLCVPVEHRADVERSRAPFFCTQPDRPPADRGSGAMKRPAMTTAPGLAAICGCSGGKWRRWTGTAPYPAWSVVKRLSGDLHDLDWRLLNARFHCCDEWNSEQQPSCTVIVKTGAVDRLQHVIASYGTTASYGQQTCRPESQDELESHWSR